MSKTPMRILSTEEHHALTGALRIAVEEYDKSARAMDAEVGHERLAQHFRRQEAECRSLLDNIEDYNNLYITYSPRI